MPSHKRAVAKFIHVYVFNTLDVKFMFNRNMNVGVKDIILFCFQFIEYYDKFD